MYASPNFLRMSMYLELSRPDGDISRWEKVLKRLSLLNKNHPLMATNCDKVEVQRSMKDKSHEGVIFDSVRDTLINQGVVFFGGFAISLYSEYYYYLWTTSRMSINMVAIRMQGNDVNHDVTVLMSSRSTHDVTVLQ